MKLILFLIGNINLIDKIIINYQLNQRIQYNLFYQCSSYHIINLYDFETSQVTIMENAFQECYNLVYIKFYYLKTENLINISSIFYENENLIIIDLSNFNTDNIFI